MHFFLWFPWQPRPYPTVIDPIVNAGENALRAAYLNGFKDGFLLAVAIFSILFLLFRSSHDD